MSLDNYKITVPPAMAPVKLCDVKEWCRVTHTSEDVLFAALIDSAVAKAELYTNRAFINRTLTGDFSHLDCSRYEKGYFFELRRAPLSTLTSVTVMVSDVVTTISSDEYNLKEDSGFSRIVFEEVNDSPDRVPYPYQVTFVAGYGANSDAVPAPIKMAINEAVCYWYQNRGDCDGATELPPIAKGILGEYRILNTYG